MGRLALLVIAVFLLFSTRIAEALGVLLAIGGIVAGGHAAVNSFRRAWTGPSHTPQRCSGVRLRGRDTSGAVAAIGTRVTPVVVDDPPLGDGEPA